jgi:hypothetical protein
MSWKKGNNTVDSPIGDGYSAGDEAEFHPNLARETGSESSGMDSQILQSGQLHLSNASLLQRKTLLSFIQPGRDSRERLIMVFAYIDDTGTHDATGQLAGSEVAGAVGYVSRMNRWAKLDWAWRHTLPRHGVKVFHAVDLRWRRGEFAGWSDDQEAALIVSRQHQ